MSSAREGKNGTGDRGPSLGLHDKGGLQEVEDGAESFPYELSVGQRVDAQCVRCVASSCSCCHHGVLCPCVDEAHLQLVSEVRIEEARGQCPWLVARTQVCPSENVLS